MNENEVIYKKNLNNVLVENPKLATTYEEFKKVLAQKFGKDSKIYKQSLEVFAENALRGGAGYGIPRPYEEYWKPYKADRVIHHVTLKKNIAAIKEGGLEPRDPTPRPWGGMKAIFMCDPSDPLYLKSEQAVLEHARKKGEKPILLRIKTKNRLFKSIEPQRTFQVISLDPIAPSDIIAYIPADI